MANGDNLKIDVDVEFTKDSINASAQSLSDGIVERMQSIKEEIESILSSVTDETGGATDATRRLAEEFGKVAEEVGGVVEAMGPLRDSIDYLGENTASDMSGFGSTLSDLDDEKYGFEGTVRGAKDRKDSERELEKQHQEEERRNIAKLTSAMQATQHVAQQGFSMGTGLLRGSLGLLEDIHGRLKAASPLLQAVESLFQTAMTLFFLPLGNKLGELLIPAVIELLDNVVGLWDLFDGDMTLGEMFSLAIDKGAEYLSGFFMDMADTLKDQGGILGSIGGMIEIVAKVSEHLPELLEVIISGIDWMLNNLDGILGLLAMLYTMQYALGITQMIVTILSNMEVAGTTIGSVAAGGLVASLAAGGLAGAVTEQAIEGLYMAEGGYVPPREGGSARILAEAGEGEYVIPESKMGSVGATYITNNFYGYTTDELIQQVNMVIEGQISRSRIGGGF